MELFIGAMGVGLGWSLIETKGRKGLGKVLLTMGVLLSLKAIFGQ